MEIFRLISIWSNDTTEVQLEGCRKSSDFYEKIAKEFTEGRYTRTIEQCHDKMKKSRVEYKKLKTKESRLVPEWDYFDAMNDKMQHMPATR